MCKISVNFSIAVIKIDVPNVKYLKHFGGKNRPEQVPDRFFFKLLQFYIKEHDIGTRILA